MPEVFLPNVITEDMLVDFSFFTVKDSDAVYNQEPVKHLEASKDIINFILRTENYTPYVHYDLDGTKKIGYNLEVNIDSNGLTEEQAYNIFIEQLKIAERNFKRLIPVDTLSQTQYDALVSLFYRTGTFKKVGTEQRKFDIYNFIKEGKWNYVATALIESGNNRKVRQQEARILMTANYGIYKDRSAIKEASIKTLEREYPDKMIDNVAKKQAEIVYFKETNRFLPGLDQAKMRFIKNS